MAYLFNRLNNELDQANGRRASDVLQGGPVQQDKATLGLQGAPGQSPLGSQSSAVIGGGQGTPQPNAATEAPQAVSGEARNKIFAKNQGQQLQVDVTKGVQSGIARAQDNLKSEANKYATENAYQAFDTSKADKAIEGNAQATSEVRNFLDGAAPARPEFSFNDESLSGLKDETRALQSQSGLANALQAQGNLTRGEAALDASFLSKSDALKYQRQLAAQQFASLASNQKETTERLGADIDKERDADKEALRNLLQGRATALRQNDSAALKAENAARAKASQAAMDFRNRLETELMARPEFADQGFVGVENRRLLQNILNDKSLDRFNTVGDSIDGYVSEGTARRFNRINDLLGIGERINARGDLGGRGSFDAEGYRNAVMELLNAQRLESLRPPRPESEGRPVPVAGKTFNRINDLIEGIKNAGRAADPTNADGYTNPISGPANVQKKAVQQATKVAEKLTPKLLKKPVKKVNKGLNKGANKIAEGAEKITKKFDPRRW